MPVPGQVSPFSPCSPSSPSGSDGGTPASASWRRSPVNAWLSKGLSIDRLAPQTPGRPSRPWPVESADHEPPSVCPSSASSSATGGPGGAAKKEKRRREHEASSFFTSYWFDQKAQDCSFERKRRKDLRCQLEDLLRSSQADLGGVKDTLANPAEAAQRGADAVMRVADVGADCVVGAANDGIGVLRDLASDVEDTAQAGMELVQVLGKWSKASLGSASAAERVTQALEQAKQLGNVDEGALRMLAAQAKDLSVDELLDADVEGPEVEMMMRRSKPVFICLTCFVAAALWLVMALVDSGKPGVTRHWIETQAGLDSFFPGETTLQIHSGCTDHRSQLWRLLTYQFTHTGIVHVTQNVWMTLILGLPLEGFHGSRRMFFMFNVGVFGGACCVLVWDVHRPVVGMSAGMYALLGMHAADLILNWGQKKYRKAVVAFLLGVAVYDVLNTYCFSAAKVSHAAHFGGWVAGVCVSILFGVNLVKRRWERWLRVATLLVSLSLTLITLGLGYRWPPQNLWEAQGWCESPPV